MCFVKILTDKISKGQQLLSHGSGLFSVYITHALYFYQIKLCHCQFTRIITFFLMHYFSRRVKNEAIQRVLSRRYNINLR